MWEKIKKWVFGLKSGILASGSLKLRLPNNPQPPSFPPKNIVLTNANNELHGLCIGYGDNGNVEYKQRFINGILHGITEEYLSNGDLFYKKYWINGEIVYDEIHRGYNRIEFTI